MRTTICGKSNKFYWFISFVQNNRFCFGVVIMWLRQIASKIGAGERKVIIKKINAEGREEKKISVTSVYCTTEFRFLEFIPRE